MTFEPLEEGQYQPCVGVDFDETLHPYTGGWVGVIPDDERPTEGAREALEEFQALGWKVVVFSVRASDYGGKEAIWEWLRHENLDHLVDEVTHVKPHAFAYIDDRAVPFTGNWTEALNHALALKDKKKKVVF